MSSNSFVLEYLERLQAKPFENLDEYFDYCLQNGKPEKVLQFRRLMRNRADGIGDTKENSLYNAKNSDFKTALLCTSCLDYIYLYNLLDWITNHRAAFGDTILEVGCDIGIISCFLGLLFPEKNIVAIDKFDKSINCAKQLAQVLNVSNVKFERSELKKHDGKYATVLSCRTMHENMTSKAYIDHFRDIADIGISYQERLQPYATAMAAHVEDGGNIISVERAKIDPQYLGWLLALNEKGFGIEPKTWEEIVDRRRENDVFQVGIFNEVNKHGFDDTVNIYCNHSVSEATESDIYGNWGNVSGWASLSAMHICSSSLIEGYILYRDASKSRPIGKRVMYYNKYDEDSMLYLQFFWHDDTDIKLASNSFKSFTQKNVSEMREAVRKDIKNGYAVFRILQEGGKEVIGEQLK